MSEPQNPPAFPSHFGDPEMNDPRNRISCGGMTLRDYFAGQALAGAMVSPTYVGVEWTGISRECYAIADAMLLARTKGDAA